MTTLFILTRDFRIDDALTLYRAQEESKKSNTNLSVVFRFDPKQIDPKENAYYSSFAVTFMIEALHLLQKDLPFQWISPISDEEWKKYLNSLDLHKIFIARDFTPYARQRYEFYKSICETVEVDDITVFPIEEMKAFSKLAPFITSVDHKKFPEAENRKINWKKEISHLPSRKFVHQDKINLHSEHQVHPLVHPTQLQELKENLGDHIKGYANKREREQLGDPKVSYLSAFIKFGLISIRQVHHLSKMVKGPSAEDKKAFHRELYFRDFYYTLAWNREKEVFEEPDWEQKSPKFISEQDLLEYKKQKGKPETITEAEKKEMIESREIFEKWVLGETESELINAGMHQLVKTGYMLNRMRMLTTSYLTRDHGLWWKYPEQIFANYLTDYDWTINSMNHQNIAKVGLYPKYTQDFSIRRQESLNPKDKEKYIKEYNE
jgi:deoxyribodipyrimidine photo-lyase